MSLLSRFKEARLGRVLFVYLGASWVVVEAAALLQDELHLPEWVVPVTLILLLVGLVVVVATAWVQASPATDQREAAGEVPTDWELDLSDLARAVRRGRLPHLTWGRAVAGGVVAFLALFGLATLVFPGDDGAPVSELRADPAAPALAVLPFRVSGPELGSWREGLVDLLSRNLDGLGGLRAIDSRTVLARWNESVEGDSPDLAATLEVARRTGARWALVGGAVEVGSRVRVTADVYEVDTGRRVDGAVAEGVPDSLFALVDGLSVAVARTLVEREDPGLSGLRLANITTESPEALRRFLEGEAAYRRLAFGAAVDAFEAAVELDPEFALAYYRLGSARGWLGQTAAGNEARQAAYDHRDRLPEREALMVEADYRSRIGALASGVELIREGVGRYPDDPEMWYQLGDAYIHWGPQLLKSPEDAEEALRRAVELDPGFAPYRIHLVELALVRGDSAEAARQVRIEREAAGSDSRYVRAHRVLFDYIYGTERAREAVVAGLDTLDGAVLQTVRAVISLDAAAAPRWLELANLTCAEPEADPGSVPPVVLFRCHWVRAATGRIERLRRLDARMRRSGDVLMPMGMGLIYRQTGLDPDAPADDPDTLLAMMDRMPAEMDVSPFLAMAAMLAAERGRASLVDSIAGELAGMADSLDATGDTLNARIRRGMARGLEGLAALAADRRETAMARLEQGFDLMAGSTGPTSSFAVFMAWPLAGLYEEAGRYREALRLYESMWTSPHAGPAILRRAEIHERLGEQERARDLYAHFLAMWAHGDTGHPMVQRAREALAPG